MITSIRFSFPTRLLLHHFFSHSSLSSSIARSSINDEPKWNLCVMNTTSKEREGENPKVFSILIYVLLCIFASLMSRRLLSLWWTELHFDTWIVGRKNLFAFFVSFLLFWWCITMEQLFSFFLCCENSLPSLRLPLLAFIDSRRINSWESYWKVQLFFFFGNRLTIPSRFHNSENSLNWMFHY